MKIRGVVGSVNVIILVYVYLSRWVFLFSFAFPFRVSTVMQLCSVAAFQPYSPPYCASQIACAIMAEKVQAGRDMVYVERLGE